MHASTGRARSKAAVSPPTMIESVPWTAPISPPLTGASSKVAPRAATWSARRRVATGEMLLMSMITLPGASPSRTPPSPAIIRSTSGVSGSIVMTIEDCRARSGTVGGAVAPAATSSSTGPRLRLNTCTG